MELLPKIEGKLIWNKNQNGLVVNLEQFKKEDTKDFVSNEITIQKAIYISLLRVFFEEEVWYKLIELNNSNYLYIKGYISCTGDINLRDETKEIDSMIEIPQFTISKECIRSWICNDEIKKDLWISIIESDAIIDFKFSNYDFINIDDEVFLTFKELISLYLSNGRLNINSIAYSIQS